MCEASSGNVIIAASRTSQEECIEKSQGSCGRVQCILGQAQVCSPLTSCARSEADVVFVIFSRSEHHDMPRVSLRRILQLWFLVLTSFNHRSVQDKPFHGNRLHECVLLLPHHIFRCISASCNVCIVYKYRIILSPRTWVMLMSAYQSAQGKSEVMDTPRNSVIQLMQFTQSLFTSTLNCPGCVAASLSRSVALHSSFSR